MGTKRWDDLGRAVRDQRLQFGWTQRSAAERAGLSLATWRLVESGGRDGYQDLTIRSICRVFGWPNDAIQALLDGGLAPKDATLPETGSNSKSAMPREYAEKYVALSESQQAMVHGYIDATWDLSHRDQTSQPSAD